MIIKGLKGPDEFTPLINWYQTLLDHRDKIVIMIQSDQSHTTMHLFLGIIKPGFVSKSFEVAKLAIEIMTKMCKIFHDKF